MATDTRYTSLNSLLQRLMETCLRDPDSNRSALEVVTELHEKRKRIQNEIKTSQYDLRIKYLLEQENTLIEQKIGDYLAHCRKGALESLRKGICIGFGYKGIHEKPSVILQKHWLFLDADFEQNTATGEGLLYRGLYFFIAQEMSAPLREWVGDELRGEERRSTPPEAVAGSQNKPDPILRKTNTSAASKAKTEKAATRRTAALVAMGRVLKIDPTWKAGGIPYSKREVAEAIKKSFNSLGLTETDAMALRDDTTKHGIESDLETLAKERHFFFKGGNSSSLKPLLQVIGQQNTPGSRTK
ncbi:MAG: hypothetical protein HQL80_05120 [Magnetococcales bacterium]|nr:hypothetical protein [Magnetococcales bacterium]MBF0583603.1 hypothetical protein [Magnetococcales bacterium]